MTQPSVLPPDRILLDDVRFRTTGPVFRTMLSQWAPKVTEGDTDRDSDPIRSTLGFSDLRGGIGLDIIEGAGDTDRLFWSTHDTRHAGHIIHAPAAIGPESAHFSDQRTIPIPSESGLAAISVITDFGNELYVCFGTKVYKWNESSTEWSDVLHTLPGVAKMALVTRLGSARTLYLIVACGSSGYSYTKDGSTWNDVTNQEAMFMVWWDYQVWALADDGLLSFTDDLGGSWTEEAWLPLPDGSATAMFVAPAGDEGLLTIHVVSKDGTMWQHNAADDKFVKTFLELPFHPDTGVGANVLQGSIYIPSGLALYEVDERRTVPEIGPDRDGGLPQERSGRIIQVIPKQRTVIILVEGETEEVAMDFLTPGLMDGYAPLRYNSTRRPSTILERVGRGWQVLWSGGQDGLTPSNPLQLTTGHLSSAYGKYRLWFGTGTQLWYIDIPVHVVNPRNLPNQIYAYYGESITPWFNAQQAEALKVALSTLIETRNLAVDEAHILLDAAFDYDEAVSAWQPIQIQMDDGSFENLDLEDSTLQDPFFFKSPTQSVDDHDPRKGVAFRAIRFRIRSYMGTNQMLTPDINSLTMQYYKRRGIVQKYSFSVNLDLSQTTNNMTAGQQMKKLDEIAEAAELVPFTYLDRGQQLRTHYVRLLQERRAEFSGPETTGAASLLELAEI